MKIPSMLGTLYAFLSPGFVYGQDGTNELSLTHRVNLLFKLPAYNTPSFHKMQVKY